MCLGTRGEYLQMHRQNVHYQDYSLFSESMFPFLRNPSSVTEIQLYQMQTNIFVVYQERSFKLNSAGIDLRQKP